MDVSEATLADLLLYNVLVEYGAVIKLLSCTINSNAIEV